MTRAFLRAFKKSPLKVEIQLWVDYVPQFPTRLLLHPTLSLERVSLISGQVAGTTPPCVDMVRQLWPALTSGRLAGMQEGACLAQFLVSLKAASQVLCKTSLTQK